MGSGNAKNELRAAMREVRRTIAGDAADRARRSRVIAQRVVETLSGRTVQRLMVYEALPGEPELERLTTWAAERGLDVVVPLVDGSDLRVMPGDVDPASLDVVVVPGLAFTRDGHRLGQGGGHFDRFLPRVSSRCLRIGVAFKEQLVDELPLEPHDVVVDIVVADD